MPSITDQTGAREDGAPYDPGPVPDAPALVQRRVPNADGVTHVRLEAAVWSALEEIAMREDMTLNEVCWHVAVHAARGRSLPAALRAYALRYFRSAAKQPEGAEPPPPLGAER
jgi:predicted DNA-binding ribbon-helix-helix protein